MRIDSNISKDTPTPRSIIYDDHAIEVIKAFPGVESHHILDLFIEFQKSYRTGFYSEKPTQYRRNNSDVINHFRKWCRSKKNSKALERTPENSRLLDQLKIYLSKYYRD